MHLRGDFMSKRSYQSLMIGCLLASTLWAANDPFVGRWKLNSAVEDGLTAYEQSLAKLADVPTPAGPTPWQPGRNHLVQL
jgi:hypothetical protein